MKKTVTFLALALIAVAVVMSSSAFSSDEEKAAAIEVAPSADEQVAAFEAMCAESAEDRAARHAETSLFERLGGEENVHAITKEIVRLHHKNEAIAYLVENLDDDELARKVAEFMIAGTGGPNVYEGPSLTESHAHLELTNDLFMAAGGDVIQAMKNKECGENEINEMMCLLVALRDQVVMEKDDAKK